MKIMTLSLAILFVLSAGLVAKQQKKISGYQHLMRMSKVVCKKLEPAKRGQCLKTKKAAAEKGVSNKDTFVDPKKSKICIQKLKKMNYKEADDAMVFNDGCNAAQIAVP